MFITNVGGGYKIKASVDIQCPRCGRSDYHHVVVDQGPEVIECDTEGGGCGGSMLVSLISHFTLKVGLTLDEVE